MIISRTPLRISFVGGGSDIPAHYRNHSGAVVSAAIDKFIFITVSKRFDDSVRVGYSRTEEVPSAEEVRHPLVRAAMQKLGIVSGIEITSIADVPSRGSGLGSSSAFTVGLLHALYAHRGVHRSRNQLAADACNIEIDICGEPIGKQDQYATSTGGLNYIRFNPDDSVDIEPVIFPPGFLNVFQSSLMMFYTGMTRSASQILQEQAEGIAADAGKARTICRMGDMASHFRDAVLCGDLESIGRIIHEAWLLKKTLATQISSSSFDDMYRRAREAGALGGKILGAGGGGFFLFCVPPERQAAVRAALSGLRHVPFGINWTGSIIIFYTPTGG